MRRHTRRTAGSLARTAVALTAVALTGAGCLQSDTPTDGAALAASAAQGETWVEAWDSIQPPALPTEAELVSALGLNESQTAVVRQALADWSAAQARHRAQMRDRAQRGNRGDGPFGVPGAVGDAEPPLLAFLGAVVPALEPAQTEALATLLRERLEAGPEAGGRGPGRGPGHGPGPGGGPGHFLGMVLRDLDLSTEQRDALRDQLQESGESFHELRVAFAEGTITAEELRDSAKALREELEAAFAEILSDEQLATLQAALDEHRAEMATRRLETLEDGIARRAAFLTTVLQLSDTQAADVTAILQGTIPARTAILTALRDGTMEIEDALYQGYVLAEQTADAIRAVLTTEQAAVFDALKMLIPGHHRGPGGP